MEEYLFSLDERENSDIKFIVESEEISAHRCVLADISPKYRAQFYGSMPEKSIVNVNGVTAAAFKEFLQFFYTSFYMNEAIFTIENIEEVLDLSEQSLQYIFVDSCEINLENMVGLDKLVWCYRLALRYEISYLQTYCMKYINADIKTVFHTTDFLSSERDMLSYILNIDSLKYEETQLFDACILWAQAKCEQEGKDATKIKNLRVALRETISKIPFCSMKGYEIVDIAKKHRKLFSSEEVTKLFMLCGRGADQN